MKLGLKIGIGMMVFYWSEVFKNVKNMLFVMLSFKGVVLGYNVL